MKRRIHISLGNIIAVMLLTVPLMAAHGQKFSAVNADGKAIFYNITSSSAPYSVEICSAPTESKYTGEINIPETAVYAGKTYTVTSMASIFSEPPFRWNSEITSITLPNTVGSPDLGAFSGCRGLTSIKLPDNMGIIQMSLFSDCISLETINIPDKVKSIGSSAFLNCKNLVSVKLPASLESMELNPFTGCSSLKEFQIDENNKNYSVSEGVLFEKGEYMLVVCPGRKKGEYILPNTVTFIGYYAFSDCGELTSITLSERLSATTIYPVDYSTFKGCKSLTEFRVAEGNRDFSSIDGALYDKYRESIIVYPANKKGPFLIPDYVQKISNSAFENCTELTSVTLPASLQRSAIDNQTFGGCTKLTEFLVNEGNSYYSSVNGVVFNKNKTSILAYPAGKGGAYSIPGSVIEIESYAFWTCDEITSIIIPPSVKTVGYRAFYCENLTEMYAMSINPPSADSYAFNNYPITTLYVPIGSKTKYQSADGWKDFRNIVEMDFSGIEDLTAENSNISITIVNGRLQISGAEDSTTVQVYNTAGNQLVNTSVADVSAAELPQGVLIVAVNGKSYKVVK